MLGPDGVPSIVLKRRLLEAFNCSWHELHDIDLRTWREMVALLEVEAELQADEAEKRKREEEKRRKQQEDPRSYWGAQ